jgi:hypothetical protein
MVHRSHCGRNNSCTEEDGPKKHETIPLSLLHPLVAAANSVDHDDKRPRGGNLLCSFPFLYTKYRMRDRCGKTQQRYPCCGMMVMVLILVFVLILERMIFSIRYMTMGRPAFLYGTPMDWDTVKGCLSTSWKQELKDFKVSIQRAEVESSNIPLHLNPDVVWTWHRYSDNTNNNNHSNSNRSHRQHHNTSISTTSTTTNNNNTAKRRLLIAQYSGFGSYTQILNQVAPINQAYARRWGHDYVTLQGTALHFPGLRYDNDRNSIVRESDESGEVITELEEEDVCPSLENGYEAQSTFNKLPLLFHALEMVDVYDQILILDTDTMIVDFDFDITTLLLLSSDVIPTTTKKKKKRTEDSSNNEYFVAAYRVWWSDWPWTWDINAGITLWNLNHATTRQIAQTWLTMSMSNPRDVLLKNDDQFFLQRALMSIGWWKRLWHGVRTVRQEMEYYDATLIKHFKRDARSWTRTSLQQRLLRIQESKKAVCDHWPTVCQHMQEEDEDEEDVDARMR